MRGVRRACTPRRVHPASGMHRGRPTRAGRAPVPASPTAPADVTARGQKGYAVVTEESGKAVLPMAPEADLSRLAPRFVLPASVGPVQGH
ncbi:hypothetical protein ABZ547_00320 [Streptomyces sparsogenes]|uniref:hypothetical protein n=1 Tax=Streptomyces sparsogenes TaxID=67365 RepID=UPI0033C27E31